MSPQVSIIVPCLNEQGTIGLLLEAIRKQTYLLTDMEVIISDGMSTDGTRAVIREFSEANPGLAIQVVDNLEKSIPSALNRAIEASQGGVVIRLDAHSVPNPDYVEICLGTLESTGAANVGGRWDIRPGGKTWVARAIAAVAQHPLGAGDARYRAGGAEGEVDTVPFGAFPRHWYDRVGPFDEGLLSNEDYEYNFRLRSAGGVIWFTPRIEAVYFARRNLADLARQYGRYGFWKSRMLVRHPSSIRWRQLIPALFVAIPLVLLLFAPWVPFAGWLLAGYLVSYVGVTLAAGVVEAIRNRDASLAAGFPLALATMHFSWGGAFIWGILTWIFGGRGNVRRS